MDNNSKIYVPGLRGLVGSALPGRLDAKGYSNIMLRTHSELDLEDPLQVRDFFAVENPELVFPAAAKVGGIMANSRYPVDFVLRNIKVQTNMIEAAWRYGVKGFSIMHG